MNQYLSFHLISLGLTFTDYKAKVAGVGGVGAWNDDDNTTYCILYSRVEQRSGHDFATSGLCDSNT